jgi:hypothetical protein
MEVVIFVLVALCLLKRLAVEADALESQRAIYNLVLPAALFVALVAFQMAPLPPPVEAVISPSTFGLYQKSLPWWPERPVHERSLSASADSGGVVLLPTSGEVTSGTAIPFAGIEKPNAFRITRLDVENIPGLRGVRFQLTGR